MKIATYNVNGVNGRLPVLLRWLAQSRPDIVCLQELKAPQEKFPQAAIRDALRVLHPGERVYTFWKFFRNAYARNAGLRIDHLLLSPSLAGRLVAAEVDREVRGWEKTSDHAPAWVELADAKKKRGR